jgi:25S rRNA (uracil2843-N3)-methyltransferase
MAPSRGKQQPRRKGPAIDAKKPTKQDKKIPSSKKSLEGAQDEISPIPLALQQLLLDIFHNTFPHLLNAAAVDETLDPLLQIVKGHLYERDFTAAFGKEEHLQAYAVRWSASRALGYVRILQDTLELMRHGWRGSAESVSGSTETELEGSSTRSSKIVCIGGGAGAEIVALAGVQHLVQQVLLSNSSAGLRNDPSDDRQQITESPSLDIVLVDIADWSGVTNSLHHSITTPPPLSDFASASARAAATPLISNPSSLKVVFTKQDVLDPNFRVATLLPQHDLDQQHPILITLMFTLNELYSTSVSSTQRFLLDLTTALPTGALLLVVDSPGSYSTVKVGQSEKKYPMSWLLEHVLLTTASAAATAKRQQAASSIDNGQDNGAEKEGDQRPRRKEDPPVWEEVLSEDSKWNRLPEDGLKYPIELENMRYQMHLYRRI